MREEETFAGRVTRLGVLADPVRRALYRFVAAQRGPVSRDQAADGVEVPRHTAKHHLDRLVDEGLLVTEFRRLTGRTGPGAGRPAKLYAAADVEVRVQLPPRDDELLARLLAAAIESSDSPQTRDALLRVARAEGERTAGMFDARDRDALLAVLRDRGYAPCVQHDEIRLRNCPFHHLVAEHRELVCRLNLELLAAATTTEPSAYEAVLDPRSDLCCVALRTSSN
jgi:predicted ArsR family transcriptional regulator